MAESRELHRMTPEELKTFVLAWCDGRVVSDRHVGGHMLTSVFPLLGLGALSKLSKRAVQNIGLVFAYTWDPGAGGMAVNGWPMFLSLRLMHKKDWNQIIPVIEAERKRRQELTVTSKSPSPTVPEAPPAPRPRRPTSRRRS